MYTQKRVLCAQRVRQVHRPFGWVDVRLVREHWLRDCSPTAWALYLFWVVAADAQGVSYYADASIAQHLQVTVANVAAARTELVRAGVAAYEAPWVQLLALDRPPAAAARGVRAPSAGPDETPYGEGAVLLGELLRAWTQKGQP